jgi:hypothetical protein
MSTTRSRDLTWVLAGVVAVAVLVSVAVVLAGRDDVARETGSREAREAPGQGGAAPSVKMDRVPLGALLPNLLVLPAEELGIGGREGDRVLRFASILANDGDGPLQVAPVPDEVCPPRQRYVEQRVFVDADRDAAFDRRLDRRTAALPGGCMIFHPRHEHWHFDSTASYALTAVDDATPIVSRDKVSFCLRDSEPLKGASTRHRRSYDECARNRRQGISVGWADRYDATLAGQRLPLPAGFTDGRYCLRLEVDPFGLLREADEGDNTSAVVVDIRGRSISRVADATC